MTTVERGKSDEDIKAPVAMRAIILPALRETPRLWGLEAAERARRTLRRAGITAIADENQPAPADSSVIIVRSDVVYEGGIIEALKAAPRTLLADGDGHTRYAAHVPARNAAAARRWLDRGDVAPEGMRTIEPQAVGETIRQDLRRRQAPLCAVVDDESAPVLERRLYEASYKGITDLVTKYLWPEPARHVTMVVARLGLTPNMVTSVGAVLMLTALWLFWQGAYGWGLLAGWLMTFLDTVDGKLARVTLTATRFGRFFDHGIDLVHPPFWYLAWGIGLAASGTALPPGWLEPCLWAMAAGYVGGRLAEGYFRVRFGFEIFVWRRFDSRSRLVTARRNPNLLFLSAGWMAGRPDLGFLAVVVWTLLSTVVLWLRIAGAEARRAAGRPVTSWLDQTP